jgi:hypothetical protein
MLGIRSEYFIHFSIFVKFQFSLYLLNFLMHKLLCHLFLQDKHFGLPSVLVVCGDHGMKNSGSHGGATLEEVLVPLVIIGDVCSGELSR